MLKRLEFMKVFLAVMGICIICDACRADDLPFESTGTRIVVVDLDRTARELGWMDDMQKDLESCGKQLQSDMKKFGSMYDEQLNAIAHPSGGGSGNGPTTAPSREVARDAAAARQQMGQLRQKADQLYAGYRTSLVARYREALLPTVQQVARGHRAQVVLVKNDTVLLVEKPVDITDAVIDAARAKPPTVPTIPIPRLEGPAEIELPGAPATQPASKP